MEQNKNSATRPSWYTQGRVECIEAMESAFSGKDVATFCRLNAFKYVWRSTAHKDSDDVNVRKAIWFLERSLKYSSALARWSKTTTSTAFQNKSYAFE